MEDIHRSPFQSLIVFRYSYVTLKEEDIGRWGLPDLRRHERGRWDPLIHLNARPSTTPEPWADGAFYPYHRHYPIPRVRQNKFEGRGTGVKWKETKTQQQKKYNITRTRKLKTVWCCKPAKCTKMRVSVQGAPCWVTGSLRFVSVLLTLFPSRPVLHDPVNQDESYEYYGASENAKRGSPAIIILFLDGGMLTLVLLLLT